MHYPTTWDPFFADSMTLADIYHYPTQHFCFHQHQLTLTRQALHEVEGLAPVARATSDTPGGIVKRSWANRGSIRRRWSTIMTGPGSAASFRSLTGEMSSLLSDLAGTWPRMTRSPGQMRLARPSDKTAVARLIGTRCDWLEARGLAPGTAGQVRQRLAEPDPQLARGFNDNSAAVICSN